MCMNDFAGMIANQAKYETAEEIHRQVLEHRWKALGPENSFTLINVSDIAEMLDSQGMKRPRRCTVKYWSVSRRC